MAVYLVQSAQATTTTSPGTVTLPASTRAGNTLVALASIRNTGATNATLSSVTLGGLADNFGHLADFGATGTEGHLWWYADPLCAGGQTAVAFTTTGGAGTEALTMSVLEVGGLIPLPAVPASVDVSAGSASASASAAWTSGLPGDTSWGAELILGGVVSSGTTTVTGPVWPWVNLAEQSSGTVASTLFSYVLNTGVIDIAYSGTLSASLTWSAGIVTLPGLTAAPALPNLVTGYGPQQGDLYSLVTSPLAFAQQRTVFRATQSATTTTLPSSGAATTIKYDTVLEDPYEAWSTGTFAWAVPFTGWYQVTFTVGTGTAPANTILAVYSGNDARPAASLVLPSTGGSVQGIAYVYGTAGQDSITVQAAVLNSASNVSTSTSLIPTLEITYLVG